MKSKTVTIFIILAAGAATLAYVSTRSQHAAETVAEQAKLPALFPGLESRINDVTLVTVQSANGQASAELSDGAWKLKEKSGYPIDAAKVREVVLNIASMKNLEPRTNRPELYKSIGVEDVKPKAEPTPAPNPDAGTPDDPASRSLLVTLGDKQGKPLASVIVGNPKYESGGKQGVYVRKPGEAASYLADMGARRFDVPREAINWIETKFVDVGRDRVRSVTITPREGGDPERVVVLKEKPDTGAFAMQNIPAGKELKNPGVVETFASGLAQNSFEDVAALSSIDFDGSKTDSAAKPGPSFKVRTWDGLIVDVATVEQSGKTWWKLIASADPDPFKEAPAATPPAPAADRTTPPAPPPAEPKPRRTPEEVAKEVAELNTKWSPWAFAVPSYKSSAFNTKMTDQLKDPAPPTPPGQAQPGAPGTPTGLPEGFQLPPGLSPQPK